MKNLIRKALATLPWSSVSFSAKSALIATSLVSAGRVFAGGTTSGIQPSMVEEATLMQLQSLQILVDERISSPDTPDTDREALLKVKASIEERLSANESQAVQ